MIHLCVYECVMFVMAILEFHEHERRLTCTSVFLRQIGGFVTYTLIRDSEYYVNLAN